MKVVALVPIKLNSQRVPHKNILPIKGKPLCWHICNTLLSIEDINDVYVYCSDETVIDYIPKNIHFLKRSKELDKDEVKGFQIYDSFIKEVDADIYVLAHTTSPFITSKSISCSLKKVINEDYDSAFSARMFKTFAWYKNSVLNYDLNDVPRTQDIEPVFIETSAFYIFKKEIFTKYRRRIGFNPFMQIVNEIEAVDIDTKEDYEFAYKIGELQKEKNI